MKEKRVDLLDRDILVALQRDGRQSNVALSQAFHLSPSAMLERVRRLEADGAIRGYRAIIDPAKLGITLHAVVNIQLKEHSQRCIAEFEAAIRKVPGVRACYHVTGQFDMVALLDMRDHEHLSRLIRVDIAQIPGVMKLETGLILGEAVTDEGWPILSIDAETLPARRATK
jgi:Lrp/AsnC family transcriptional regulator, leucine-responsive regulatory protein